MKVVQNAVNNSIVIDTLCERIEFIKRDRKKKKILEFDTSMVVRFLEKPIPIGVEMLDPDNELSVDDISVESLEKLDEEQPEFSWPEYSKSNIFATARQFLSTNHFKTVKFFLKHLSDKEQLELGEPYYQLFSDQEISYFDSLENLVKVIPDLSKTFSSTNDVNNYGTSFFGLYAVSDEKTAFITPILKNNILEIMRKYHFEGIHNGYALGNLMRDNGIIELESGTMFKMKHISFWGYRNKYSNISYISEHFQFFNL
ncbi:hypothetical protein [Leuconostoc pseudomesenteroides]|uniref:hypothetical protein n=1 Tax=Leuconostoc pseudomesenteroides TaxID=33968 RepID=UPI0039E9DC73